MSRCRACGGTGQAIFSKRGFLFAECGACGCRYVVESGTALVYDGGYFEGDSFGGYPDYLGDRRLIVENFARRIRWLERLSPGHRLLDVGAAYGFLVSAAKTAGFDAVGLEPATACVDWARRELGVKMLDGTVETIEIEEASLDVVTLFDVIEHVENPAAALARIRSWLRPGGLVAIETGDFEALLPRICGRRWYYYDPPQHLTYFSRQSLVHLLASCDFEAPCAIGHLGRSVSLKNVAFQLGRSLGDGVAGGVCRRVAASRLGRFCFDVPDRGNVFLVAARVAPPA